MKARKPNQPRLRFDIEKLRDPDVACTFQTTIGGKFAGKKPWVTKDVLDLCDERRELKKKRHDRRRNEAKEYREANRRIQKAVKKAKEDWIGTQCKETETRLNKNNKKESISAGEGSNLRETG